MFNNDHISLYCHHIFTPFQLMAKGNSVKCLISSRNSCLLFTNFFPTSFLNEFLTTTTHPPDDSSLPISLFFALLLLHYHSLSFCLSKDVIVSLQSLFGAIQHAQYYLPHNITDTVAIFALQ